MIDSARPMTAAKAIVHDAATAPSTRICSFWHVIRCRLRYGIECQRIILNEEVSMTMRFATLLFLASNLGFAGNWTGFLVDSNCYGSEERNVNKNLGPAERDMRLALRACSPSTKTRDFAVVFSDWDWLKFDATGNARAADLVRNGSGNSGNRSLLRITVTGERSKDTISVSSISAGT
jgi:hypothetical protein